ncbi:hypothetical protein FHS76_003586 [Ochrobactrum daejeonense]|uniref:Uncharacterized protein n=1 Tax=Brucella daejeonensis TaxID=659015 RepID=A0A7W9EMR5_9HYPH|nr:hypothetical protein [Brucella daejeonensis]MBB5703677.1 hypothetical protein [Brucella daejeonensis]NKB79900.1 hypothetical protein [Brucella daejeonensis]
MFGISPLGWLHTLGSLPAIPLAIYMLARHGRIVPRSAAGAIYFTSMLIGGLTVFLVAKQPEGNIIAVATLALLLAGYGIAYVPGLGRASAYCETIFLTLTVFLLMVPSVNETLTRVPDGNPIVSEPGSPILLGALGSLVVMLVAGLAVQIIHLRRQGRMALAVSR